MLTILNVESIIPPGVSIRITIASKFEAVARFTASLTNYSVATLIISSILTIKTFFE